MCPQFDPYAKSARRLLFYAWLPFLPSSLHFFGNLILLHPLPRLTHFFTYDKPAIRQHWFLLLDIEMQAGLLIVYPNRIVLYGGRLVR